MIKNANGFIDITGQRFDKLLVIKRAGSNKQKNALWECICDCGNKTIVIGTLLRNGHTKSCGKCGMIDLTGKVFGKLTAIKSIGKIKYVPHWKCQCACGNETTVSIYDLLSGHTKSCGCGKFDGKKIEYGKAAFNKRLQKYKRDAKYRKLDFLLTEDQFKNYIFSNCYYCGKEPSLVDKVSSNGEIIRNGIDRIDNSKGYIEGNVRPCCTDCNMAKKDMSEEEFISQLKRIREYSNLF